MEEFVRAGKEVVHGVAHAAHIQQHGGLAHDAAHGQDAAGDDAVDGAGQNHRADHVPLAAAQAQGTLPIGLGHRLQGLLGGADDGGQVHHCQGQAGRQQGVAQAQRLAEGQIAHQGVQDGGDAGQGLGGKFDGGDQLVVGGVLGEVHCRPHAQGKGDAQGDAHHIQGVADGGQNAQSTLEHRLGRGKELPAQLGDAPPQDIAHQKHQQGAGDPGAQPQQAPHPPVIYPAVQAHGTASPLPL